MSNNLRLPTRLDTEPSSRDWAKEVRRKGHLNRLKSAVMGLAMSVVSFGSAAKAMANPEIVDSGVSSIGARFNDSFVTMEGIESGTVTNDAHSIELATGGSSFSSIFARNPLLDGGTPINEVTAVFDTHEVRIGDRNFDIVRQGAAIDMGEIVTDGSQGQLYTIGIYSDLNSVVADESYIYLGFDNGTYKVIPVSEALANIDARAAGGPEVRLNGVDIGTYGSDIALLGNGVILTEAGILLQINSDMSPTFLDADGSFISQFHTYLSDAFPGFTPHNMFVRDGLVYVTQNASNVADGGTALTFRVRLDGGAVVFDQVGINITSTLNYDGLVCDDPNTITASIVNAADGCIANSNSSTVCNFPEGTAEVCTDDGVCADVVDGQATIEITRAATIAQAVIDLTINNADQFDYVEYSVDGGSNWNRWTTSEAFNAANDFLVGSDLGVKLRGVTLNDDGSACYGDESLINVESTANCTTAVSGENLNKEVTLDVASCEVEPDTRICADGTSTPIEYPCPEDCATIDGGVVDGVCVDSCNDGFIPEGETCEDPETVNIGNMLVHNGFFIGDAATIATVATDVYIPAEGLVDTLYIGDDRVWSQESDSNGLTFNAGDRSDCDAAALVCNEIPTGTEVVADAILIVEDGNQRLPEGGEQFEIDFQSLGSLLEEKAQDIESDGFLSFLSASERSTVFVRRSTFSADSNALSLEFFVMFGSTPETICLEGQEFTGNSCRDIEPVECGEGEHEEAGVCVDDPENPVECGEGEHEEAGVCVDDSETPVCGEGEHEEAGVCVDDFETPVCGEGEHEEAGVCVDDSETSSNGDGGGGCNTVPDAPFNIPGATLLGGLAAVLATKRRNKRGLDGDLTDGVA